MRQPEPRIPHVSVWMQRADAISITAIVLMSCEPWGAWLQDVLQRWGCALDADRVRRRLDRLTRQKDALQSILKRFNKHAAKKATAGVKKKPKKSKLKLGRGIVA
eukprot:m.740273 g.740273  ORF g.740273 m.740273 type:complete len:105 (-) comp23112_c0_seq5:1926-2240(-)